MILFNSGPIGCTSVKIGYNESDSSEAQPKLRNIILKNLRLAIRTVKTHFLDPIFTLF